MKDKLIKLSFSNEATWKQVEETLSDENGYIKGVKAIIELKQMQRPPAADWIPDPENPDDNGWGVYDDWAVDVVVKSDFDYTDFKEYLISEPNNVGHRIDGKYEIIYKMD